MPELPGTSLEARVFTSTYYDTPPHSLARCGITLRCRVEDDVARWQLKLPRDEARAELEVLGEPDAAPAELTGLLVAHLRYGPLEPVATLQTHRTGVRVVSGERSLADVLLDSVSVLGEGRVASAFAEIEVELIDGDEADLERLGKVLRRAGARGTNGTPKLLRVIEVPEVVAPARAAPPVEHLRFLLTRQLRELETYDPGVRLGAAQEDLHRFRVATRRSRALIRASRPLVGDRLAALADELRWLGDVLGPARDLDVLIDHLREVVEGLDDDTPGGASIVTRLEGEREVARSSVIDALGSERYLALLDRIPDDLEGLRDPVEGVSLAEIARAEARRLRRAYERLGPDPEDDRLHALRIKAKHVRYAAELAAQAEGKPMLKLGRAAREFQDVIGSHQDAVVAEERVRALLHAKNRLAAGRIIELERARRREARKQVPAAWRRVDRAIG